MGFLREADKKVDMTEIMAAAAKLKGHKPPSGRVIVSASTFPVSAQIEAEAAAAKKTANLEVGDETADGVYAGLAADGKHKIFAMPKDLEVTMTFNDAVKRVGQLNADKALGHDDWQMPALENLHVLQKNQNEGTMKDTFKTSDSNGADCPGWYWSSTKYIANPSDVRIVRFSDGIDTWHRIGAPRLSCRPVRLVAASPS